MLWGTHKLKVYYIKKIFLFITWGQKKTTFKFLSCDVLVTNTWHYDQPLCKLGYVFPFLVLKEVHLACQTSISGSEKKMRKWNMPIQIKETFLVEFCGGVCVSRTQPFSLVAIFYGIYSLKPSILGFRMLPKKWSRWWPVLTEHSCKAVTKQVHTAFV